MRKAVLTLTVLASLVLPVATASASEGIVVDKSVTVGRTGCNATARTGRLEADVFHLQFSYTGPSATADLDDCI